MKEGSSVLLLPGSLIQVVVLLAVVLEKVTSQVSHETSLITLNLVDGQKTAYLEPGYVGFAEIPTGSFLGDKEVVNFPQFGLSRDPISFEEQLSLDLPVLVYHFFESNFSLVLQFGDGIGSPTRFCKFTIKNKVYSEVPKCSTMTLTGINWPLIGSNPLLLKAVNPDLDHNDPLLTEIGAVGEIKRTFGFVALNNIAKQMRTVICGVSLDSPPECTIASTKSIDPIKEEITSLQIVGNNAFIYLNSFVLEVPYMLGVNSTLLQLDADLKHVQFYNGSWWGIDSLMHLCTLTTVQIPMPTQEIVRGNISLQGYRKIITSKSYATTSDLVFKTLTATENYLVSIFANKDQNVTGVTVFGFVQKNTLSVTDQSQNQVRQLQAVELEGDSPYEMMVDKVLYEFDYTYNQAPQIHAFFEWQGNLIMFGNKALMILTVPWVVGQSDQTRVLYPEAGTVNKTYGMRGSNILYVLPTDAKSVDSLAILSISLLVGEEIPVNKQSSLRDSVQTNHINLAQVQVLSPYLQFEKYSDDYLLSQSPVKLDFFYNDYPAYKKVTYQIEFKKVANKYDFRLIGSLIGMCVLLIAAIVICLFKSHKAINKPADSSSILDKTIKGTKDACLIDKSKSPVDNVRPSQHSRKATAKTRKLSESDDGSNNYTAFPSTQVEDSDLYRMDPSPKFGKVMLNDELPDRLAGKQNRRMGP